jgi:hypothetical protein
VRHEITDQFSRGLAESLDFFFDMIEKRVQLRRSAVNFE